MRLLFVVSNLTAWSEMLPLGRALRDDHGWEITLLVYTAAVAERVGEARALHLDVLERDVVERAVPASAWSQATPIGEQRLLNRRARWILELVRPDVVGFYCDRALDYNLALLHEAKRARIPTALVPVALSVPGFIATYRQTPTYLASARRRNRLVAALFPRQAAGSGGERVLFYEPERTLTLAALGMLPRNVWALGGGDSDRVLVSGEVVRDQLVAEGVPPGKVEVTGQLSHDALHAAWEGRRERRAELNVEHGFDPERPLIVVALPHFLEHGLMPPERHERELDQLLERLCATRANVLVSLHPKTHRPDYDALAGRHRIGLARRRLSAVLPCGDAFVAAFPSTIPWAILAGVQPVFVDAYGLNHDVSRFTSALVVADLTELTATVEGVLLGDPERTERLAAEAARLAPFDGKAGERIAGALFRLAEDRPRGAG